MTSTLETNGHRPTQIREEGDHDLADIVGFTDDSETDEEEVEDIFADDFENMIPDEEAIALAIAEAQSGGADHPLSEKDEEAIDSIGNEAESLLEEDGTGTVNVSSGYEDDEEEDDEDLASDPRRNKTKVGLINSPFSQMGLVGGGVLLVVVVIGGVLTLLTGTKTEKPIIAQSPTPETGIEGTGNAGDGSDTSKIKSDLAITRQQELLQGMKPGQPKPSPSPNAAKSPTPTSSASPVAVASLPPVPIPVVNPLAAQPQKSTLEDSVRTWQLLSSVGSYGRVPSSGGSVSRTPTTTSVAPASSLFNTPPVVAPPISSGGGAGIQQLRASSSMPGMRDRPLAPVLVGTNAKGRLGTAIVLPGDNSSPIDPTNPRFSRYLVQLTGAIKDADGAVAIPSGTVVVAAVRTFSPSTGKAELQAIAVIVNNREYKLPEGAVIIRAADGGMIAFNQQGKGSGLFQAVLPALMSGVAQVGQSINQPASSSVVSAGSVTTSVSSNKSPNLFAAFASGMGTTLTQQLTQQAQASNQAASQQQKAWAVSAGTEVQVFVNSTFEM